MLWSGKCCHGTLKKTVDLHINMDGGEATSTEEEGESIPQEGKELYRVK